MSLVVGVPAKGYVAQREDGSFSLYNPNSCLLVFSDHDELENNVIPINWSVQRGGTDLFVSEVQVQTSDKTLAKTITFSDGSKLVIDYTVPDSGAIKIRLTLTAGRKDTFQIVMRVSGLQDDNTSQVLVHALDTANKKFSFTLPAYLGSRQIGYDWSDIKTATVTQTVTMIDGAYAFQQIFPCGAVDKDASVTFDPTTVTTTAGQYSTAYGNTRHLIRDNYGKLIYVGTNTNLVWAYCNSPPSGSWASEDLGSSYAVSTTAGEGVCSIAYDSANDRLMIAWVDNSSPNRIKCVQLTPSRDGSGNITGKSLSSILTITPNKAARRPSLWMLHNGEVGLVHGDNSTGGSKHGDVHSCRVVFGNPPTYKNWAGTSSQETVISSVYTSAHSTHAATIAQRTNSGTGQYDVWALWMYPSYNYKKNKGNWMGENWNWDSEATPEATATRHEGYSLAYESANGLIIYTLGDESNNTPRMGKIDSSDTDTEISPTVNIAARLYPSCCCAGADIYNFYIKSSNVWHRKRSGGSWGDEIQFTSSNNEGYPNVSLVTTNRIDLVWTHYTGSVYNVYYDYVSLEAPPPTGGVLAQVI